MPALLAHIAKADCRVEILVRAKVRALLILVAVFSAVLFLSAQPSAAHSRRADNGPVSGIVIPSLSHGQMAVIADYRRKILKLADAQSPMQDMEFRRVLNYARIQFTYCLWGLAPSSIKDENSPFNECSHAYLAATKALLLEMNEAPFRTEHAAALMSDIDMDMIRNNTSLVLCQYSNETFNTASVIKPDWNRVPFHIPSFAGFAGFTVLIAVGVLLGLRTARTPS